MTATSIAPQESPIRTDSSPTFIGGGIASDWTMVRPNQAAGEEAEINPAHHALTRLLYDLISSQNLVVLCGSGTSVGVRSPSSGKRAPSMSDLWTATMQVLGTDLDTWLTKLRLEDSQNIELFLSRCHAFHDLNPDNNEVAEIITKTEQLIVDKCRFIEPDSTLGSHELFFRKLGQRPQRHARARIFTTNYDLCFETAASNMQFNVIDGFSQSRPQYFDGSHFAFDLVRRDGSEKPLEYIPNVLHLYKIHGSVDWQRIGKKIRRSEQTEEPLLIYPQYSKFESSYSQPFLEMMSQFQLALRQQNLSLIIVGFGFNDDHLVQPILAAIRSNVDLRVMIVSPDLEMTTNHHLSQIRSLIEMNDSRISMLCSTFENFVSVIPNLRPLTETELHADRLTSSAIGML